MAPSSPKQRLALLAKSVGAAGPALVPRPVDASDEAFVPRRVLFTGGAEFIGSNALIHMVTKYPETFFVCFDNLSEGSNWRICGPSRASRIASSSRATWPQRRPCGPSSPTTRSTR